MKALLPALAASTALHAAVLAVAVSRPTRPHAPPPAAAVDIELFVPGPRHASAPMVSTTPVLHHSAPRATRPVQQAVLVPAAAVEAPLPRMAEEGEVGARAQAPPTALTRSGPASAAADLDLTAFFQRLQSAAQRCSGPRAGEGRVRFCVGADGAPTEVSLVQSTGNFALDEAALHCVIPGAAPFPLTDRCLVVPLRFQ